MSIGSVSSRTRRLLGGLSVVGAVIAGSVAVASVTSTGAVLALPGASESTVVTVEPTRVLDTRFDVGLDQIVAATPDKLQVAGTIDTWIEASKELIRREVVPAGATGVLMNVTAVSPTAGGYLSVRPGDATGVPATAGLNFNPGDVVPNAITVALPTSGSNAGQIDLYYGAGAVGATMDLVIDIVGYTTNTGLIDLVNRVTTLENSGVGAESPARVIWVADDGTGDYLLLSEALAAITDASSSKPYVIKIAPGFYAEPSPVVLKGNVDVEGSGQGVTTITCECGSGSLGASAATVSAGEITAEIRHLTIVNTGPSTFSVGVYMSGRYENGVVFSMDNVTATARNGSNNYGVYNLSSTATSAPSMSNVTATATGGATSYGVYNNMSSPLMSNVTATATGGVSSYGVFNESSLPLMSNVTATAYLGGSNRGVYNLSSSPLMSNVTATATGGTNNRGVVNSSSSTVSMNNVTATATGSNDSFAVLNDSSSVSMNNVTATSDGGWGVRNGSSSSVSMNNVTAYGSIGVSTYGSSSATIRNSAITGWYASLETTGVYSLDGSTPGSVKVADTVIDGDIYYSNPGIVGSGFTCLGVYTAAFVELDAVCSE